MLAMTKSATVFVNYLASQYVHSLLVNLVLCQGEIVVIQRELVLINSTARTNMPQPQTERQLRPKMFSMP
jgi:hypothetical protein